MKKRFCGIAALVTCVMLAMLALSAGTAVSESAGLLGTPFPDFTAADTEGTPFTLSEALKNHEAVLINFWASWCGPCGAEFPVLNDVYGKYGDRVAFIALSIEENDTMEAIEAYRAERGLSIPMGRDEGEKLYQVTSATVIPVTVVVDRFGNTVFYQEGIFQSENDLARVLDTFLGDGYTETAVLNGIPKDTSTRAFPVSAARALYPDSGDCRKITLYADALEQPRTGYIVPGDSVRVRIEIAADDNVESMIYVDTVTSGMPYVVDLLDPERGVYVYDQRVPDPTDDALYVNVGLFDMNNPVDDDRTVMLLLFRNEESIGKLADQLKEMNYGEVRWEYADAEEKAENTENTPQAYVVHVVDQDSNPVGEVTVNFCTDTSCVPKESDGQGTIVFTGEPAAYHVTIIDAPEGYSWDENFEMYTTREYGEWILRVRKD